MNNRPMNASLRLRLLLLLPVTLVLVLSVLLLFTGLGKLKNLHNQAEAKQQHELNIILDASSFNRQLVALHQQASDVLNNAINGQPLAPAMQVSVTDGLNSLNDLLQQHLLSHHLLLEINQDSVNGLHDAFERYQGFINSTLEALAANPQLAEGLLAPAQQHFLEFSSRLTNIKLLLAERVQTRNQQQIHNFSSLVNQQFILGVTALLLMFAISQFLLLRASRNLLLIADGLHTLAHSKERHIPLPRIEQLQQHGQGDARLIATRLLDLRHVLEHQNTSEDQEFHLAFYDTLTRLPNRRLLQERISQTLTECKRHKQQTALLVLDIDSFKNINETRGHDIGDQVLVKAGECLCVLTGEANTVSRIGSNAFAILLPALSKDAGRSASKVLRLNEAIKENLGKLVLPDAQDFCLSACTGVTFFDGSLKDVNIPLMEAEAAMYRAKEQGRGKLCYYDAEIQAQQQKRLQLESDLSQAIEKQQLQLFYQLQVNDLAQPVGVEALLRWHHPAQGMISPAMFIPLAESSDLILPIGQWVLETACHQLRKWSGHPHWATLSISVNVSARQLRQSNFVGQVRKALEISGANPERLKLELTESMLLKDFDGTISKMEELRALGVRFALDDFGTGYSSLQYLKRLPLDQLKIEQTFARDVTSDKNDAAIVQTIIAMGQALELEVLAEGVETAEQQDFLRQNGCALYQGYLYSRPVPVEQIEAMLSKD